MTKKDNKQINPDDVLKAMLSTQPPKKAQKEIKKLLEISKNIV